MFQTNERNVIRTAMAVTAIFLIIVPVLLLTMQTPGVSRLPVPEAYSQGEAVNGYVNNFLPVIIVLSILFIAGLSTFGLYHGSTRELLGKRPLIHRPFAHIKGWRYKWKK